MEIASRKMKCHLQALRRMALFSVLWLAISGCKDETPRVYSSVVIDDVPHIKQKPDFCGEACAAMYLRKLGERMDQDYVYDRAGVNPSLGRGLYASELADALSRIGFAVGDVWTEVKSDSDLRRAFEEMLEDLHQGVPSIVGMKSSDDSNASEHFRLILGYDSDDEQVIYHEPAVENGAYQRMDQSLFIETWPLGGREKRILVRLRLAVDALEYGEASDDLTDGDYAQYIHQLKKMLPSGFSMVFEKPFVVVGNEPQWKVAERAEGTVRWAVEQLKSKFFKKDPQEIVTIWIFRDEASYYRYPKKIFGEDPISKYGYYSPSAQAIFVNVSYGNGSISHEIVHPFVRANLPSCPAWFNEGLGALYETATEKNGAIWGRTNWRLIGLRQSIREKSLLSFERLTGLSAAEFYGVNSGTHYAQARYLCQYLQSQGKLAPFYYAFARKHSEDPSGFSTLKEVLGETEMNGFESRWQAWAMTLQFD